VVARSGLCTLDANIRGQDIIWLESKDLEFEGIGRGFALGNLYFRRLRCVSVVTGAGTGVGGVGLRTWYWCRRSRFGIDQSGPTKIGELQISFGGMWQQGTTMAESRHRPRLLEIKLGGYAFSI
jgi:hypothetical protein